MKKETELGCCVGWASDFISRVSRYVWGTRVAPLKRWHSEPVASHWRQLICCFNLRCCGISQALPDQSICHPGQQDCQAFTKGKEAFRKGTFGLWCSFSSGVWWSTTAVWTMKVLLCAACCQHWLTGLSAAGWEGVWVVCVSCFSQSQLAGTGGVRSLGGEGWGSLQG